MSELIPPRIAAELDAGRKASNLAFALRRLPPDRRKDALVFYRFCRIVDDIADSDFLRLEEKETALGAWRTALTQRDVPSLPEDLAGIIRKHDLDWTLLAEIVEGMRMDLHQTRYATFEALRTYCWRVASAVGLVSARIFGCTSQESREYAETLGIALQLTNILRDVAEDAGRDRIYLPLEDIDRFGIGEANVFAGKMTDGFVRLMEFEAARAEEYFRKASAALRPEDRDALRAAETMRAIYSRVLARMRKDGFRVFEKRYRLNSIEKLIILLFGSSSS